MSPASGAQPAIAKTPPAAPRATPSTVAPISAMPRPDISDRRRAEKSDPKPIIGELVKHGWAPFKFDPTKSNSYFVTLNRGRDKNNKPLEETHWAVDLERGIQDLGVKAGERIGIRFLWEESVATQSDGTPKSANKTRWLVRKEEYFKRETKDRGGDFSEAEKRIIVARADNANQNGNHGDMSQVLNSLGINQPQLKSWRRQIEKLDALASVQNASVVQPKERLAMEARTAGRTALMASRKTLTSHGTVASRNEDRGMTL
jgi:transposase-like protein